MEATFKIFLVLNNFLKNNIVKIKKKEIIFGIITGFIGVALYFFILYTGIFLYLPINQYDNFFLILILLFFFFIFLPEGKIGEFTGFIGTLTAFSLQLSLLWGGNNLHRTFLIGGMIPYIDAQSYYLGALQLLGKHTLNTYASRRPLFSGFVALILKITGGSLLWTGAILTLIPAISTYFLARQIKKTHGAFASAITSMIIFHYFYQYLGSLCTETLGLSLGACSLALFWNSITTKKEGQVLLSFITLTTGLIVRAGAFFILPSLLFFYQNIFFSEKKIFGNFFKKGLLLIILIFLINQLVFNLVGNKKTYPFGNIFYRLYGLVTNRNWQAYHYDFPELLTEPYITEKEIIDEVSKKTFKIIKKEPFVLLKGTLRAWKYIGRGFFYSFFNKKFCLIFNLLSTFVFLFYFLKKSNFFLSFLIWSALGIFLSMPFVTPWDSGVRAYTTTLPILAVFPAVGFAELLNFLKNKKKQNIIPCETTYFLTGFSIILVILSLSASFMVFIFSKPPETIEFEKINPPQEQSIFYFKSEKNNMLLFYKKNSNKKTRLPYINLKDFENIKMQNLPQQLFISRILANLKQYDKPALFFKAGYFLEKGRIIIGPKEQLPDLNGKILGAFLKSDSILPKIFTADNFFYPAYTLIKDKD